MIVVGGGIDTIAETGEVARGTDRGLAGANFTGFVDGALSFANAAMISVAVGIDAVAVAF